MHGIPSHMKKPYEEGWLGRVVEQDAVEEIQLASNEPYHESTPFIGRKLSGI